MVSFQRSVLLNIFSSPDEEAEFRIIHHNPGELRKILLIGIFIYNLFLILDNVLFPEYFKYILFIRIGIVLPVLIILFLMTFSKYFNHFSVFIIMGIAFSSAIGIILIEYIVRDNIYSEMYFYGIAQVLILILGTGKLNFLQSLFFSFGIIVPAVIVDSVFIETDILRILTKSIFMFTMGFLGVIASTVIQNTARARFMDHKRMEAFSITDALTGLKNRHFYRTVIVDEIIGRLNIVSESRKRAGVRITDNKYDCSYAFILIDLDYFKNINDEAGHEVGDQVLIEFSARILKLIRVDDSLIRWGGDEFLLLLQHLTIEGVELLVKRIKTEITDKPFETSNKTRKVTVSGGVFMISPEIPDRITNADDVFALADKALYVSKDNGRNRFTQVFYEQSGSEVTVCKTIGE